MGPGKSIQQVFVPKSRASHVRWGLEYLICCAEIAYVPLFVLMESSNPSPPLPPPDYPPFTPISAHRDLAETNGHKDVVDFLDTPPETTEEKE